MERAIPKPPAVEAALAEKRDLLARLLGRLAHEIRNPLSSVDIHFQLLEEDLLGVEPDLLQKLSPRLELIQGELHRLKTIVERFLRLASPSAIDPELTHLEKVVGRVCELLRPEAESRGVQLLATVEPSPEFMADPVRLMQALLNLVINAIQAVGKGGRVEIRVVKEAGRMRLEVLDDGPGIPPEKLGSIFEPYFTTKAEGHGLGLWIAQQIIVAHRGTLEAGNRETGGAVFIVMLPLRDPAQ